MDFLYLKALHIIFVVTWFAGLFYIVRLFIYHVEARSKDEPERSILISHFKIAERRLWYGITWPSMLLTLAFGFWSAFTLYGISFPGWLITKLAFVLGLLLYHFECHIMFRNLQRDSAKYTSFGLRLWNELATIFLISIVFIVVIREQGNALWSAVGLCVFAILLFIAIWLYRRRRNKEGI